jgi:hypothetical protein
MTFLLATSSFAKYVYVITYSCACIAGSKSWMPKFIVKPKSTGVDPKRQKNESTSVQESGKEPVGDQKTEPAMQTNVLQSLCQDYDSDDSE